LKKKERSDSPAHDKFLGSFSPGGSTEETATHFVSRSSINKKDVNNVKINCNTIIEKERDK